MLNSILTNSQASVSIGGVLICSLFAIIFGFLIAMTHKFTSKYNKNFLTTVSMLPLLVQCVILLVNGNLGMSVAIAGTFGLVRFRSVPGTSKEILTVFFSMAVGLAMGMGYVLFGGALTLLGCLVMVVLSKSSIFEKNEHDRSLKITIPEDLDYTEVFVQTLKKYTSKYALEQVKTTNLGSLFELRYSITLKDKINEKEFLDELRVQNGNLKIVLTQPIDNNDL